MNNLRERRSHRGGSPKYLDNCTVNKKDENNEKKVIQASCNFIGNKDERNDWSQDSIKIKRRRAQGGCQGTKHRRKTWPAAKSHGEPQAGFDPWMSEWGNPAGAMPSHRMMNT